MTDAFDRWIEWANKPPGERPRLPSEIHATLRSLSREDRTDRQKVNAAVEHGAELSWAGRTAWIYLNDYEHGMQRNVSDSEWVKVFASAEAANRWFDKHDPEGVAWECQSALDWDPRIGVQKGPFDRRVLLVALGSSELAGVAETRRARLA